MGAAGRGRDDRARRVVVQDRADPVAAWVNSRARQTASSVRTESLPCPSAPKLIEADWSSTSQAVSSRSSVYWRTYGSSSRAVTFQSMCRTSSSGVYSRRPAKSMPVPRNTVR